MDWLPLLAAVLGLALLWGVARAAGRPYGAPRAHYVVEYWHPTYGALVETHTLTWTEAEVYFDCCEGAVRLRRTTDGQVFRYRPPPTAVPTGPRVPRSPLTVDV